MKTNTIIVSIAFSLAILILVSNKSVFSQSDSDSTYLPRIRITSANGYGPYYINTKRTNVFIADSLPVNTSKITMRFLGPKGEQLGDAFVKEGSNLKDAIWVIESEDVGFTLSPTLSVELNYSTDSTAKYSIAYTVYPDTIKLTASAGWGPFYTNTYPLSDTSIWHPVADTFNTFNIWNLPPNSDSLVFQILTSDSTVLDSMWAHAPVGEYLDSARWENLKMDTLNLATRIFRALIFCEGGPENGLEVNKDFRMIPQQPQLRCLTENSALTDSIPPFIQNQIEGQALHIDSVKHAVISNGPGSYDIGESSIIYPGPVSLDVIQSDFTIEAWMKFDIDKLTNVSGSMMVLSVDDVWGVFVGVYSNELYFDINSLCTTLEDGELLSAWISLDELNGTDWHHIAFTSEASNHYVPEMKFFFDGKRCHNTEFDTTDYLFVRKQVAYNDLRHTQPLNIGKSKHYTNTLSVVTAIDEIRIWREWHTEDEIQRNYHRKVLQSEGLKGYFNFDDLRNRLGYISDLSYYNNRGMLKNGATFIKQYPYIQMTNDSIIFLSSNENSDSVHYSFIDKGDKLIVSQSGSMENGGDTLLFDVSGLSDNVGKLNISEYAKKYPDTGYVYEYLMEGYAPPPIATPRFNWNKYYNSDGGTGSFYNSILVSGLPNGTSKVVLGLEKAKEYFDVDTLSRNSIPYAYSLALNGIDNYIETTQNIISSDQFSLSLWFKTTTEDGGRILGFSESAKCLGKGKHDREIMMEKDGSIRFYLRSPDSTYILVAAHKLNDGEWHHVAVSVGDSSGLYIDGCLVDMSEDASGESFSGYWIMGKNDGTKSASGELLAEYFTGSICEVMIMDTPLDYSRVNENLFELKNQNGLLYHYKFDDKKGVMVKDYSGDNDGHIRGSAQNWFNAEVISLVSWNSNMIDKEAGTYDFFTTVFYAGGPPEGKKYKLGRNFVEEPIDSDVFFGYNMRNGFGYFNEGTRLINYFDFSTAYDKSDAPDWQNNFVNYKFFDPDHYLIDHGNINYTSDSISDFFALDMGDAPPGSYMVVNIGYHDSNYEYPEYYFSFPIYTNTLIPPILQGNFGPFDQAIAPGTMPQSNTFIIKTEILSDLNTVIARFHDKYGNQLAEKNAVQINDTIWHITYEMGKLKPPRSTLSVEYYLGSNPRPALVQGPFPITIHKTRPRWFDFLADTSFHDVMQSNDTVSFAFNTPFEKNWWPNHFTDANLPKWVPLFGGTKASQETPHCRAKLRWIVPEHKLEFNQNPTFYTEVINFGGGNSSYLSIDFNSSGDDTYSLDSRNDLIATQNLKIGGTLSHTYLELPFFAKRIANLLNAIKYIQNLGPSFVVPAVQFTMKGSFEYAARLHMITDTINGGWGSYGNLFINADPNSGSAYTNSASYHFYSGSLGLEAAIGLKVAKGFLAAWFGLDLRVVIGYGHSYITIPSSDTRKLKSAALQFYGRAWVSVLWGWYSHNVWGPKMFKSYNFWGDDLSDCFPPATKNNPQLPGIKSNSSWKELADEIVPVRKFSQMPMPFPQARITSSTDHQLFTWIEKGSKYGERILRTRYLDLDKHNFSGSAALEINNNALNTPVADALNKNLAFFTWAQSRHNSLSFAEKKTDNIINEFVKSQDIWYAIYDLEKDSMLIKDAVADDFKSITSGRVEANPVIAVLSDSRSIICWQVADSNLLESDIWYMILEEANGNWLSGSPQILTKAEGTVTDLKIASPNTDEAVITWLETDDSEYKKNKIMSAAFNVDSWSPPIAIQSGENDYYNYMDLKFKDGMGGLVVAAFIEDSVVLQHEKIMLLPWDNATGVWEIDQPYDLYVDSTHHLQLPSMTINENGDAVIAFKTELVAIIEANERICQVDLLKGSINNPSAGWTLIEANKYVCDTTKQVSDHQGEEFLGFLNQPKVWVKGNTTVRS